MKLKLNRYRIVMDGYAGYEAQEWHWYFPFWVQMGYINTHPSLEEAERYIRTKGVVKEIDLEQDI